MRIGQLAEAAGVGVETIRFYEREGLIEQPLRPTDGGYRSYSDRFVFRVRFIRQAQALGFSLEEIADLLTLQSDPDAECGDIRQRAARKLAQVVGKIDQLERIKCALETLITQCPGHGPVEGCSILEAIETSVCKSNPQRKGMGNGKQKNC